MESLQHVLEHTRPFRAVACQHMAMYASLNRTHMSTEPSRAARSSICSVDIIVISLCFLAQTKRYARLKLKNDAGVGGRYAVHVTLSYAAQS